VVWFGLKGQRSRLGLGLGLTAIRRGFELYECLLVSLTVKATYSVCVLRCSTIRSVISAWLDAYPDDFRDAPHYSALRRLRQFAFDQLPDSDLHRRVLGRLAALRRQDTVQRRPQSAGAQRQRASTRFLILFIYPYFSRSAYVSSSSGYLCYTDFFVSVLD